MTKQIAIALLTFIGTAFAETPFQQLQFRYNKERADIIAPLNKRYIQSLQAELKRTMAQSDLKAANDINAWIADLQAELTAKPNGAGAVSTSGKNNRDFFVDSTWLVGTTEFRFSPDGTGVKTYHGKPGAIKWTLLDDNTVEIDGGIPEYFFFYSRTRGEHTSGSKSAARLPINRKK